MKEKILKEFNIDNSFTINKCKELLNNNPICFYNKEKQEPSAFILINKPWQEIFSLLSNVKKQTDYMPRMEETTIIKQQEKEILAKIKIKVLTFNIYYYLIFDLSKKNKTILFNLDKTKDNSVKEVKGYWKFYPNKKNNSTIVEYFLKVHIGRFVPEYIEEILTKKDLPKILISLKNQAES